MLMSVLCRKAQNKKKRKEKDNDDNTKSVTELEINFISFMSMTTWVLFVCLFVYHAGCQFPNGSCGQQIIDCQVVQTHDWW